MMPVLGKPKSITSDILCKLLEEGLKVDPLFDYLADIQHGAISEGDREKLHDWIFHCCKLLKVSSHTKEQACRITDSFLKTTRAQKHFLQLLGITSVQLAIKSNESFVIDLNTLSQLCGEQYSAEAHLQFEEILLEKLGWNPYLPTASETLNHIRKFIFELALDSQQNGGEDFDTLKRLSEIFNCPDFMRKAEIFVKIALLDYKLSKYSAFVTAMVASLCVLKNGQIADYYKFLEFIANKFQNEEFILQLYQANKVAAELFQLQDEDETMKDILGIQTQNVEIPEENPKTCEDLNQSLNSDSSHTTIGKSSTASPNPKCKAGYLKGRSQKESSPEDLLTKEAKRKACMLRIKRKIICKRRIN